MRYLLFGGLYAAVFMAAWQSADWTAPGVIVAAITTALTMLFMGLLFGPFGGKT